MTTMEHKNSVNDDYNGFDYNKNTSMIYPKNDLIMILSAKLQNNSLQVCNI